MNKKLLSILIGCVSVSTFANSALALDTGASFSGVVPPTCAIATDFALDGAIPYSPTTAPIAGQERVTNLSVSAGVGFDCNTDAVTIDVSGTVTAPSFTGGGSAFNLGNGIDNTLTIQYGGSGDPILSTSGNSGTLSATATPDTDSSGDILLSVISEFSLGETGPEELGAGAYTTSVTLTVSPN
jgi:hypothetical protein